MGVVLCWLYAGESLSLWCFAGFCGHMFALVLCWLHSGKLLFALSFYSFVATHWVSLIIIGCSRGPSIFGSLGPRALGTRALGKPLGPT